MVFRCLWQRFFFSILCAGRWKWVLSVVKLLVSICISVVLLCLFLLFRFRIFSILILSCLAWISNLEFHCNLFWYRVINCKICFRENRDQRNGRQRNVWLLYWFAKINYADTVISDNIMLIFLSRVFFAIFNILML